MAAQSLTQLGLRFSRKAVMPSRPSSGGADVGDAARRIRPHVGVDGTPRQAADQVLGGGHGGRPVGGQGGEHGFGGGCETIRRHHLVHEADALGFLGVEAFGAQRIAPRPGARPWRRPRRGQWWPG